MLLQTNSYIVPKDRRADHARLMTRFRHYFKRHGCEFEVYEQTGPNFAGDGGGRFVQIMRFRTRREQVAVSTAEKTDKVAQQLIADFCRVINLPYQQQQGLFASGYYVGTLPDDPSATARPRRHSSEAASDANGSDLSETSADFSDDASEVDPDDLRPFDGVENDSDSPAAR